MIKSKEKNNEQKKPPVVVVLGHVDHGKSSLLEAIKDFKITAKESGGITQHIGAYEVEHQEKPITFIDTPGHEAFSAMRLRGARVADIALLVVDSAKSCQPQTKEAIAVIKKSEIPFIVVLNKIDLPTADPEKIKRELMKSDVIVESMGGQVPSVEISAKEKTGIDELLEIIILLSDMQDLKSQTNVPAEGLVIEAYLDNLKGPVATVIVEKGILKKKEIIATDTSISKIKALNNPEGNTIDKVLPGHPAVVMGFEKVPGLGERFESFATYQEAEAKTKLKEKKRIITAGVLNPEEKRQVLNIILKSDAFGSLEAIEELLKNLPQEKVFLRVIKSELGDINKKDAELAETFGAQIIGFRVKIGSDVASLMRNDATRRVKIKTFSVIYELIEDIRNSLEKSKVQEIIRQDLGKIKALVIFFGEKNRQIVGGKITEGEIKKGLKLEVIRDNTKIGQGKIINLQRNKKDTEKLGKGDECGILFEGNVKIEKGDILVAFIEERQKIINDKEN